MKQRDTALLIITALAMTPMVASYAHHSQAEFDFSTSLEITGTVTELVWKSPHAWIYADVIDDDGEAVNWGFELPSPTTLMRRGWTRKSLMPGDVITVTAAPARNHDAIALARTVLDTEGNGVFTGITEVN